MAFFDRLDTLISIKEPPLSSSLHVCELPAPSRIDKQEQAEERRERESWYSTHLPSSTIRWRPGGPETPTGNLSPRHTILLRSALSDVSTPAPASKEVSRYQATKWKWTAPSKSSRERTLCFYSFSLLRKTKNLNIKRKNKFIFIWTPWTSDQWGDDTCMRAHELLKSGFQTWVALCNSIHYRAIGGFFFFRIDSGIEETLRRFCRDKDLQKSSSRRSKVSDSQKTSERYLEVSPWEFRESFLWNNKFQNIAKIQRGFSLKTRKVPP